jgi:hypothetical protein
MTTVAAMSLETQELPAPSLADLHDIVTPEPVSWMPATIGWAVVGAVLSLLLIVAGWRAWRRWKADAYRRAALKELQSLRDGLDATPSPTATIGRVSELLKRTALVAFPRARVAALSGEGWTSFLNETSTGAPFDGRAGRSLRDLEYAPATDGDNAVDALLDAAARWIRGHRREPA